jgi:hypothetical protein
VSSRFTVSRLVVLLATGRTGAGAVAVACAVSGWSAPARAQDRCPTPDAGSPALGGLDPARRLTWIAAHLSAAEGNARLWTFGWGGGIAAAGVGSLVAVPFVTAETRVDWYTGAVSAGVGVAAFVIAPPAILHDAPALRAEIARSRSGDDVCPLLAAAEARLVHDARDEELQGRWYIHVGNLLFNAGLGLFLGLGYHHWAAGAINAAAGAAVGEAIIFTRPTATIDDLGSYLQGGF